MDFSVKKEHNERRNSNQRKQTVNRRYDTRVEAVQMQRREMTEAGGRGRVREVAQSAVSSTHTRDPKPLQPVVGNGRELWLHPDRHTTKGPADTITTTIT